ncbi:MAG TPA: Hsp20/alpha crystallin family protein [Polyangia bacterium]
MRSAPAVNTEVENGLTNGAATNGDVTNHKSRPRSGNDVRPSSAPPVDVYENADEILVVADMPGARPESVTVKLERDELFISATRDSNVAGQLLFGGRRDCEYRRTFLIPDGVDANQIEAEMSAGVLRVRLPKGSALKPRVIAVKTRN